MLCLQGMLTMVMNPACQAVRQKKTSPTCMHTRMLLFGVQAEVVATGHHFLHARVVLIHCIKHEMIT